MQKRTIMTIWLLALLLVGGALLGACGRETPASAPATTAPDTTVPTAVEAPATTTPTDEAPAPTDTPTQVPPAPTDSVVEEAPAMDGVALLEARCVDCHGLNRPTGARYTQEQWQQVVTRMIRHGAVLNAEEEAVLVAYLAETYRP